MAAGSVHGTIAARRALHIAALTQWAVHAGIPPALADAVAFVESAYNPRAVGSAGELGLMQVLPATAAMLGFRGGPEDLMEPGTNLRYGVEYLAGAWRRSGGDVCWALTKYRSGHGEQRMTPLSVDYCRRALAYLAGIGSPLVSGTM
ncbi:MAG TPA: transglycosylase SLT domain-containing protein, partial [Roseomonas sp.]